MDARGVNLGDSAHIVPLLTPGSISGGVAGQVFSLRGAAKANILIFWGALAAAQGAVTLSACTDLAGDNATPIGFDLYQQTTAGVGNDVLGPRQAIAATGYTPSDTAGVVDVLHVQADQLGDGFAYLKLSIADGTNSDAASAIAVLTGLRNGGVSNPTATV